MEAFLLAAGLGTRLRPLTNDKPKALVEVGGRTLLEINLENLIRQGAERIVVNVHHFGDQIIDFVSSRKWNTDIVISDERDVLMDTGGGLKKAQHLFSGGHPIVVHNVDILSNIDLSEILRQHTVSKAIATLATSQRETSRYLLASPDNELVGWHKRGTADYIWADGPTNNCKELAFSGIAVIDPSILELMPPASPYPIIPEYLKIAKDHRIICLEHDPENWMDVGKPETLSAADALINRWK